MNIYDCFMYFDEDLLLDLRLNTLDRYVKKFVITEATYTHNGSKKKLNFDINKFKKFKDKIIYIVVKDSPTNIEEIIKEDSEHDEGRKKILNAMARDYFQRENLTRGLTQSDDNDLILVSDLDEIPNLENLNFTKIDDEIIIFKQKMFYYKLNLLFEKFNWFGTKAIKKKYLLSPQWLRNIKGKKYSKWRPDIFFSKKKYSNIFFVENGGWHFTSLRTPEQLQKKMLNFAHHYEFEKSGLEIDDLKKLMQEKRVMYNHKVDQSNKLKWMNGPILKKISVDMLPKYVNLNTEQYKDWLD